MELQKKSADAWLKQLFLKSKYSFWNICLFSLILVLVSRVVLFLFFQGYAYFFGDSRSFFQALNIWDAQWYQGITTDGYTSGAEYTGGLVNWVFFPLYSLIVRGAHGLLGLDINLLGFLLNLLFQTAALCFLLQYVLKTRKNAFQGAVLCVLLSLGCYTLYFASYYTESLYMMLFAGALYFLHKRSYLVVGLFGFFLTLTRNTGIVLLLGMAVQVVFDYCRSERSKKSVGGFFISCFTNAKLIAGMLLVPAGLVLFMVFLGFRAGDPLAFVHAQALWGGGIGNPFATIAGGFLSGSAREFFFAVCAAWGLLLCIYLLAQKRYAEASMAFALLLIPVSVRLQSIPRYLVGNLFFALSFTDLLAKWNKKPVTIVVVAASVALEFFCLFLWFQSSTFLW